MDQSICFVKLKKTAGKVVEPLVILEAVRAKVKKFNILPRKLFYDAC